MKKLTIADCMNGDFAKISPESPVAEASSLLIQKEALGGPVVNGSGELIGWISEQECLKATLQVVFFDERVATVKDVMREDVLSVNMDDDPMELARQMLEAKPKAYPVINNKNKVVGVVTRRRILKMLDEQLQQHAKDLKADQG